MLRVQHSADTYNLALSVFPFKLNTSSPKKVNTHYIGKLILTHTLSFRSKYCCGQYYYWFKLYYRNTEGAASSRVCFGLQYSTWSIYVVISIAFPTAFRGTNLTLWDGKPCALTYEIYRRELQPSEPMKCWLRETYTLSDEIRWAMKCVPGSTCKLKQKKMHCL